MDDIEELLLGGDIETVNEVLAKTGAMAVSAASQPSDSNDIVQDGQIVAIPEDVFPKVSCLIASMVFSLKT